MVSFNFVNRVFVSKSEKAIWNGFNPINKSQLDPAPARDLETICHIFCAWSQSSEYGRRLTVFFISKLLKIVGLFYPSWDRVQQMSNTSALTRSRSLSHLVCLSVSVARALTHPFSLTQPWVSFWANQKPLLNIELWIENKTAADSQFSFRPASVSRGVNFYPFVTHCLRRNCLNIWWNYQWCDSENLDNLIPELNFMRLLR